jgi:hypothetical protein
MNLEEAIDIIKNDEGFHLTKIKTSDGQDSVTNVFEVLEKISEKNNYVKSYLAYEDDIINIARFLKMKAFS